MSDSMVVFEGEPSPIGLTFANILRRSARDAKLARRMGGTDGTVVFRSATDPQAATLRFGGGRVVVSTGADPDADMTITADLATLGELDAPKPKVTGAAAHLRLALMVAKALEPPLDPWPREAGRFWAFASGRAGVPPGVRFVAIDTGERADFGASPEACEIHGTAARLQKLCTGGSVLGEEVFAGRLYAVTPLRYLAELTGASLDWMMGR